MQPFDMTEANLLAKGNLHRSGTTQWALGGVLCLLTLCSLTPSEAGWLGVELKEETIDVFGRQAIALVVSVTPGSPAATAGIQPGDIILTVDDKRLHSVQEVNDAIQAVPPGTRLPLDVLRAGKRLTLMVTLGAQPQEVRRSPSPGSYANGKGLTPEQLREREAAYGAAPAPRHYRHDSREIAAPRWPEMGNPHDA